MAWYDAIVDPVVDVGSAAVDFVTGGGGETAANAGEAMAQAQLGNGGGGFNVVDGFMIAADYAGKGFSWLSDPDNAAAANALGGIATGVGQYYLAEKEREQTVRENRKDRQLKRDLANQKIDAAQIAPGNINDYGSYRDNVTNGLISNGMLAGKQKND